jgi:hypothetical protein
MFIRKFSLEKINDQQNANNGSSPKFPLVRIKNLGIVTFMPLYGMHINSCRIFNYRNSILLSSRFFERDRYINYALFIYSQAFHYFM